MHTLRKDPLNARGILIRTSQLESFNSNSGSSWQLFRLEQLLSGKLEQECTNIREARPQQNSGKTAKRDTVQHFSRFSRPPRAVALTGYRLIREEWCFGRERPRNENNICGLKPFPQKIDNNNFCTNRKQSYERCTLLINDFYR